MRRAHRLRLQGARSVIDAVEQSQNGSLERILRAGLGMIPPMGHSVEENDEEDEEGKAAPSTFGIRASCAPATCCGWLGAAALEQSWQGGYE